MHKKIVAVIPARAGSKGIKNKNLALLKGRPLISYTIETAKKSKYIQEVYISTDSDIIGFYGETYGCKYIKRPSELAQDNSLDIDWVKHFLTKVSCDLIVHLRATTPIRDVSVVDKAIALFLQDPEATSLRSAHALEESPYKMFIKDGDWFKPFIGTFQTSNLPRQEFPTAYHPNGYVDILRSKYIMDTEDMHGDKIFAFITPKVIEIDTPENLEELEQIL